MEKDHKVSHGTKLLLITAILIPVLYYLWSRFMPTWAGPQFFIMPFPLLSNTFVRILYFIAFVLLFLLASVVEHLFFNNFLCTIISSQHDDRLISGSGLSFFDDNNKPSFFTKLWLSIGVAAVHFGFFYHIANPVIHALIYALIALVINYCLFCYYEDYKNIVSTLLRVGLAIASLLILLYLTISSVNGWKRNNPQFVFPFNPIDILKKMADALTGIKF